MDSRIISLIDSTPTLLIQKPEISITALFNPHYQEIVEDTSAWTRKQVSPKTPEEQWAVDNWKLDFFVAYAYPTAPPSRLLALAKFYGWVCGIDDLVDLKKVTPDIKAFVEGSMNIFKGTYNQALTFENQELQTKIEMLHELWTEMVEDMTPHTKCVISSTIVEAFSEMEREKQLKHRDFIPSIGAFMQCRRLTALVRPVLACGGYAAGVDVHWNELMQDPEFGRFYDVVADHITLVNDVLSFGREWSEGSDWNILPVLMHHLKCSLQDALHEAFKMIGDLEADFKQLSQSIKANATLSCLGAAEAVTIAGNCLVGNYKFSWITGRYHGADWEPPNEGGVCIVHLKPFGSAQ